MGVVYRAFDKERGEVVALKSIREAHGDAVYRLKREFRAIAEIDHPNLVHLHDLFVDGEQCFFTMELVDGLELTRWIAFATSNADDAMRATLSPASVRNDDRAIRHVAVGIARGIDALHAAGLLHRDLKPSNVMITHDERVVVLDFGLVADAHASAQQTIRGAIAGTVAYMSPEQARGETELTRAVDAYALGVILYELLTGHLPHEGAPFVILGAKQRTDVIRPSQRVEGVPTDLDDLVAALLSHDPVARPTMAQVLRHLGAQATARTRDSGTSSREVAATIFGRDAELAQLRDLLRRTSEGSPVIGVVRGRSGIGKTALLGAFTRHVERQEGAVVFAGRCHERETVPFKGLDGVVDALSRYLLGCAGEELGRLLPPNVADLGTLFPVLRRVGPIALAYARRAASGRTEQRIRSGGFACLAELLRRIAESKPLVVLVDDVQWADDDTAGGVVELLRAASPPAMLLLLGSRPAGITPVDNALFGPQAPIAIAAVTKRVVELAPLDDDSVRKIAQRELGDADAFVEIVTREARGNPFAAGELVRLLRSEDDSQRASLAERTSGAESIDVLVRHRAESLDPVARGLLDVIVVAGVPVDTETLLRAAGLDAGERAVVERLRSKNWIRTVRLGGMGALDTVHDRVREALLDGMGAPEKTRVHRHLAVALEATENPPHDRLARHFAEGGERALAFHHALAAAESARTALAFRRAAELYGLALKNADPEQLASTYPKYADALTAAGRFEAAATAWLEASQLAQGAEARDLKRRAGEAHLFAGHIDVGLAYLGEVAEELDIPVPRSTFRALLRGVWERIRLALRGFDIAWDARERISARMVEEARTLGALALTYSANDSVIGIALHSRWLRAALDAVDSSQLIMALLAEAQYRAIAGWHSGAERVIALLERVPETPRYPTTASVNLARAMLATVSGRPRRACVLGSEAIELIERHDAPDVYRSNAIASLGVAWATQLRVDHWDAALEFVAQRDETAGPFAEFRNKTVALTDYYMRKGDTGSVHVITCDATWESISGRDMMIRVGALTRASWAHLYDGDVAKALAEIERAADIGRSTFSDRAVLVKAELGPRIAAAGLAAGNPGAIARARSLFRESRDQVSERGRLHVEAIRAVSLGRGAVEALRAMAEHASEYESTLQEAVALRALGILLPERDAKVARHRYVSLVHGSGVVDPDRLAWSCLPFGEAPARTGGERSAWQNG